MVAHQPVTEQCEGITALRNPERLEEGLMIAIAGEDVGAVVSRGSWRGRPDCRRWARERRPMMPMLRRYAGLRQEKEVTPISQAQNTHANFKIQIITIGALTGIAGRPQFLLDLSLECLQDGVHENHCGDGSQACQPTQCMVSVGRRAICWTRSPLPGCRGRSRFEEGVF